MLYSLQQSILEFSTFLAFSHLFLIAVGSFTQNELEHEFICMEHYSAEQCFMNILL